MNNLYVKERIGRKKVGWQAWIKHECDAS